jgi:predicted NUDIX family phosphoesterase
MRVAEPSTPPELVLGVPRARLMGDDGWQGVLYGDVGPYLDLIAAEGAYRARPEAEQDPSWKQVIPYLVLRDRGRLFLMRRTRAGGDARLHERWSIGIGGHLNPGDGDIHAGLAREFGEEIDSPWTPEPRLVGLLNDDGPRRDRVRRRGGGPAGRDP